MHQSEPDHQCLLLLNRRKEKKNLSKFQPNSTKTNDTRETSQTSPILDLEMGRYLGKDFDC